MLPVCEWDIQAVIRITKLGNTSVWKFLRKIALTIFCNVRRVPAYQSRFRESGRA